MPPPAERLRIAPPDPDKPPLKANVFHVVRASNTMLAPMFPYLGDGDLVPGASLFRGPNRDPGVFTHTNSVDEVAMCFAAHGSRLRPGAVRVGARAHLVGSFFENQQDPQNMLVIVVTQRQAEQGIRQEESLTFMCEKCQTPLLIHAFCAKTPERKAAASLGYSPPFETLMQGAVSLEPFNADEGRRTCAKCGHLNPSFPVAIWGWDAYQHNAAAAEHGREQFLAQTEDPVEPGAQG